jgi:betaine-aldehyde dehydrogenase
MEARSAELIAAEVQNTGKPVWWMRDAEMPQCIDHTRFHATMARNLPGWSTGEWLSGYDSSVRREPVGVCAQVAPWNYPLLMAVWKFAPALAMGNTIVLKPSDTTPVSTVMLAELAAKHLPKGVFNVVMGDRETGRALVEHPIPQMVSITGSVRAGMEVAKSAAADVKRVHLELGGKAPVIVFADADLKKAATGIAGAGFFNAGQDCTAATRVLVQKGIHDKFVAALAEWDIDISGNKPQKFTDEMVQNSNYIITMGCGDACPVYPGKKYLDWELQDPAGQSIETVRTIRDDILQRVQKLVRELVG